MAAEKSEFENANAPALPQLDDKSKNVFSHISSYLTSSEDVNNFGISCGMFRAARNSDFVMRCHKDFGFRPQNEKRAFVIYQIVKKIHSDNWAKEKSKRMAQINHAIAELESFSDEKWPAYYLSQLYLIKGNFELAFSLVKKAAEESKSLQGQLACFALGNYYLHFAMETNNALAFDPDENVSFIGPMTKKQYECLKPSIVLIEDARRFLKIAVAELSTPAAMVALAKSYLITGFTDYKEAFSLLNQARDKSDDPEAIFLLSQLYKNGVLCNKEDRNGDLTCRAGQTFVVQDREKALELLQEAVEAKQPEALRELGLAYRDGNPYGLAQDPELAEKNLIDAMMRGDIKAAEELYHSYKMGNPGNIAANEKKCDKVRHLIGQKFPSSKLALRVFSEETKESLQSIPFTAIAFAAVPAVIAVLFHCLIKSAKILDAHLRNIFVGKEEREKEVLQNTLGLKKG